MFVSVLDRLLYRHPFEGASARRYARDERPAFGDLDDRLLDHLAPALEPAVPLAEGTLRRRPPRRLLDLGCGPGTFARRAAERFPGITVLAVDPSRDFAQRGAIRAAGEALPLADRSIDVAVCLSSIRHVRDRTATLVELRRVVSGAAVIVELDPDSHPARIAHHADRLGSPILRRMFGPLVVRTAPPAHVIAEIARTVGFTVRALRGDPVQPVYIMDLE